MLEEEILENISGLFLLFLFLLPLLISCPVPIEHVPGVLGNLLQREAEHSVNEENSESGGSLFGDIADSVDAVDAEDAENLFKGASSFFS